MPRRPTRVRGFSYRGCHRYFVTSCTFRRQPFFVDVGCATECAQQIVPAFERHAFDVLAYCVMPDHVHLLIEGQSDETDFRRAVRVWKLQSGHTWRLRHEVPLWQIGYWERVLREEDDTRAVVGYLLENPVRAGLVARAIDYPFSGSARFTREELAEHAGQWSPAWKR
jgi:putative transposase